MHTKWSCEYLPYLSNFIFQNLVPSTIFTKLSIRYQGTISPLWTNARLSFSTFDLSSLQNDNFNFFFKDTHKTIQNLETELKIANRKIKY